MKYQFRKTKDQVRDKLILLVTFEGGDGDTRHPQEIEFTFPYSKMQENIEVVDHEVEIYKTLEKILRYERKPDYDEVKEEYGEEVARALDNAPNDPQCDYQLKCYVDRIELVAYDESGTEFKAYTN